MRVHSLVAPKFDHYSAMSGDGFKNLTVYKGKGGAMLTPEQQYLALGLSLGGIGVHTYLGLTPKQKKALKNATAAGAVMLGTVGAAGAAGAHAGRKMMNDRLALEAINTGGYMEGHGLKGGRLTPKQKKVLKGAAAAGAAMLAAAGAHAGRKMLNDRLAMEAINTLGQAAGPAYDSLLQPRW